VPDAVPGGDGVPGGGQVPGGPAGLAAVVLAGGRAARLGGADKPALIVGGQPLLTAVIMAAAAAGASQIVIVGPPRPAVAAPLDGQASVVWVREDPPGSGPVAALRCGLAATGAPLILLLAADLPFLQARQLTALIAATGLPGDQQAGEAGEAGPAAEGTGPGAVLVDDSGRPQWLVGCWATGALRAGLARYQGSSLHGLLDPLRPARVSCPAGDGPPPWLDCDTDADLRQARAWARP
jgi:molybdopterin-guanine dinucleotide biosynthesis protein A